MRKPLAIKQIQVTTVPDQIGKPELVIIALDSTGRLFSKQGLDGEWKEVK